MKLLKQVFVILMLVVIISTNCFAQSQPIQTLKKEIIVNDIRRTVNMVIVDLNNPDIELDVVISNDMIGGDEEFENMLSRKNIDAAINANFFDAYESLEPYGTIMKDGKILYLEGENTSMGISEGNNIVFDRFKTVIKGYLDGKRQNEWNNKTQSMAFYLFDVWYVNNLPLDPTGVYLYTPERGESITVEGGTAIEVINNKVNRVLKNVDKVKIPRNGYIIYYGSQSATQDYIDNRFKIGRTIEFEFETKYTDQKKIRKNKDIKDTPEQPKEPTLLYGCVDKTTKNYWDLKKNEMDFNIFNVWYVNTKPIDSTGVYLYTPERGDSLQVPIGNVVIVENGEVKEVLYNTKQFNIPDNGFVIYYGKDAADREYIKARFREGKAIDFYDPNTKKINTEEIISKAVEKNKVALYEEVEYTEKQTKINLNNVQDLISAGPYLIKEGKIIVNPEGEGFKEEKITKNRAQRSAIGITQDNKLLMVTVSNVNMEELAQIMLQLRAIEAMNLDGGASSALYANGRVITKPGRRLSTILAVYKHNDSNDKLKDTDKSIENKIVNRQFRDISEVKRYEESILDYTANKFSDINKKHWFAKNVSYLVALNIIAGYEDGTFRPNNDINVDAFIKMIITSLGYDIQNGPTYWASPYIKKAKEIGIINGGEFLEFNRPIKRGEMARMIVRALNSQINLDKEQLKKEIKDFNQIVPELQDDILKAYGMGIITGYEDGTFRPDETANRAAAATMIVRMLDAK
ncbi:phosphodiester glycosidase family protein [Thermohalobacter berrensis]|uniref:SLH domain-containing protein n=1 Tax=Thermohalobacter berrensis TaxID=99594 RepID=A0A419T8G3_9FIRM|nr:phosphodiester glycosidase family protein [Thermohalobacter berrensis]RKD33745.1 hypothetical protein BET03_08450 [Thermohalobacter berrensis]